MRIKTNFGVNTSDYSGYYFTPSDTRASTQYGVGTQTSQNYYSQSANNSFEYLWENTLSYAKTIGVHSFDFVGGVSQQKNTYREIGANGNNLPSDQLRNLSSVPTLNSYYGREQIFTLSSQFARLSYRFMDKYLVTGTVRRDGSSKFAKDHQYGIFPSGSVAWRAKQESFLQNVGWLNDLKFRAGYGEVGNQAGISPFQYLSQYSPGGGPLTSTNVGYPFGNVYQPGLVLNSLPNPNLKWETSKQTDVGFDATFLNNKLTITVDYYKKESKDFLLYIPVPSQTGFTNASRNVGSLRNSGIEVAVDYRKSVKNFSYGINANVSTVSNKLLSLATGQKAVSNLEINGSGLNFSNTGANTWVTFSNSFVGGPVGEFYGYKSAGIFQNQKEIDDANALAVAKYGAGALFQQPGPTKPGDRRFVDVNGDGHVTAADQVSLGSPIPKIYGGLTLDGTYKAFDANIFFYGVSGNKIFNYQQRTLESFGNSTGAVGIENVSEEYYLNRWTPTHPSSRYARATANDGNTNGSGRPSDVYIEDGSYLRLRSIQVGYTVASSLTSRIAISRLRFYFSAQNLFTLTKYSGLDPEIGQPAGNDGSRRVTAAGLDVGKCYILIYILRHMKKINRFLSMLALGAALIVPWSCSKNFLDQKDSSNISEDALFHKPADGIALVNAIYDTFDDVDFMKKSIWYGANFLSQDFDNWGADVFFVTYQVPANFDPLNTFWVRSYRGIARANSAIPIIARMKAENVITDSLANRLTGEAYFLRGVFYYYMACNFGGVPLELQTVTDNGLHPRNSQDSVFASVASDMNMAASLLPWKENLPSSEIGRATKGAALGYLGSAQMWLKKYSDALATYNQLTGRYQLLPNYIDIHEYKNKNSAESKYSS